MPRLSLYRQNKTNDYRFFDRTISEMYQVGGLDIFVHKYLGPKTGPDDSSLPTTDGDTTQPNYTENNPLFVGDLLLGETRDRSYSPDIYIMRGIYNAQDVDFDLSQFGLFLNNDTVFVTFHYNNMIDLLGRKLMAGDVLEFPNLKDWHPLNPESPPLPRYYVVQDASFASEGFSQTWLPHLWRVKATPLTNTQEYQDIMDKPLISGSIWDIDGYYPGGSTVDNGGTWYSALQNVPPGVNINDTTYWEEIDSPTVGDISSTRSFDNKVNDAILEQANIEIPLSGYDTVNFYVYPTNSDGTPARPLETVPIDPNNPELGTITVGSSPSGAGWTLGYLTGDQFAPNGFPVTPGVNFPPNPAAGDYALRLDYWPNRLFRFDGSRWVKIEDSVRTDLSRSPTNHSQRSTFVNNTYTVATTDQGDIPSRQSLSDLLKPTADNGNAGGNKTPKRPPKTSPGTPAS